MARDLVSEIEDVHRLLRSLEGGRGDLMTVLQKRRRQLPRRVFRQGIRLATALPLLQHPTLRMTVDERPLHRAVQDVRGHLKSVDIADRRWGQFLNVLGGVAFSMLVVLALLIAALRLRGFV